MHEQASRWVDLLERLVNLIRPKAYNTIAKLVVGIGLLQITESYTKIVHAFVIALFEENIGKSEVLRSFLSATSDPTAGLILVIVGLAYHLVVTLGKDYIDTRKSELPKFPVFSCFLLNGDKKQLSTEFTIRGCRVNLPHKDDIPDHKDIVPDYNDPIFGSIYRTRAMYGSILSKRKNEDLFRERAKLLFDWAGAELLYLNIANDSSVLASGVSVKLSIPRQKGVYLSMLGDLPDFPKEETDYFVSGSTLDNLLKARGPKVISISSDAHHYHVSWSVFKMQAKTEQISKDAFLLKTDKPVEIECVIFCDELPEPITKTYVAYPASDLIDINLDQLVGKESYFEICNKLIMDGYMVRRFESLYEMEAK